MKNIAIILGITDYEDLHMALPGCAKDVVAMEMVLRTGGKFHDVITIASADSETLKSSLANTVGRFAGDDVGDLLFYFTGHGDYVGDDYIYQLRDYNKSKVAQTSLSNTELDGLLRSVSPNILIKIVDACHSGMQYVKDGTTVADYLADETKGAFPKCYFLLSSQNDQKSYAGHDISDFTAAFANAVADSQSDTVRYKHVIDYISDAFASQNKQIPQFVVQAAFTEVLGEYSREAKEGITQYLGPKANNEPELSSSSDLDQSQALEPLVAEPERSSSLLEIALRSAKDYVSMDLATTVVSELRDCLETSLVPKELESLYKANTVFSERYLDMPYEGVIGKWLESNASGEYFANATSFVETYEVPRSTLNPMYELTGSWIFEKPTITKTRRVTSGIETSLTGLPFLTCTTTLSSSLPNLLQYKGWLTFLISKTTIQIFYCFAEYKEVTWDHFTLNTASNWVRRSFFLAATGDLNAVADEFHNAFFEWVFERTRSRLLPANERT